MKDKRSLVDSVLLMIFIVGILAISSYFMFFYRNADSKEVVALADTSEYAVYDGHGANEYWKTTLNDNQKVLYTELKEAYLQFLEYFSTKSKSMTEDEFQEVYAAVLLDHPEMFWMDSYQVITKPFSNKVNVGKKIKLFYYYDKDEAKKVKDKIEPAIQEIVEQASKLETDYQKVLFVHDEIDKKTSYVDYTKSNRHDFQSIVSILENNESVCAGYTYSFKLIMDRLGIEAVSVRDVGNKNEDENHIWNMVKLYGAWFNLDLTWDDVKSNDDNISYKYFLKTNDEFYTTHRIQEKMPKNKSE